MSVLIMADAHTDHDPKEQFQAFHFYVYEEILKKTVKLYYDGLFNLILIILPNK